METKICSKCKKELPATSEFFAGRTDRKIGTLQTYCRECQAEYKKMHYAKNKQSYMDNAHNTQKKIFIWFQELRETLICSKCGENRAWVLDFHHIDPLSKDDSVVNIARSSSSKKKILKEIDKCIVLCSNCHRDLHHNQRY